MTEVKNILLIGSTGSGKSTLANVITGTNKFKESEGSVSETKNIQIEEFEENITQDRSQSYKIRVTDTIGFGNAKLTLREVLKRIIDISSSVNSQINQLLFVTSGRFTESEIKAYSLLKLIFGEDIIRYTTIVRTNFSKFIDSEECEKDYFEMVKSNEKLAEIITSCNKVIHVNNPPAEEEELLIRFKNQESRLKSREIVLDHLQKNCQENHESKFIRELNFATADSMRKIKELERELNETKKRKLEEIELEEKRSLERKNFLLEENKKNQEEFIFQQTEERFRKRWEERQNVARESGKTIGSFVGGIILGIGTTFCSIM